MLDDVKTAPALYRPTHFWEQGLVRLAADIEATGIENFRRADACLSYFVPTYGFPGFGVCPDAYEGTFAALAAAGHGDAKTRMRLQRALSGEEQAHADYRVHLASSGGGQPHIDRVSESRAGNPIEHFEFDGRRFSRSLLNYLLGLGFLKQSLPGAHIGVVMEIGGGFGSLGEALLADPENDLLYIDVDIPPTAFAATWYLQQVLGSENVGTYEDLQDLEEIEIADLRRRYKAVVLCPWQLERLRGKIDLFVNFISFQEMEPPVVENYCRHVARLGADAALLRNLREGKQKRTATNDVGVVEPIPGDRYDRFFPDYRIAAVNTEPYGYKTVDGFHSELRLYTRR